MRLIAMLPLMLLAAGCASSPITVTHSAPCSALIPAGWTEPVPSAALPQELSDERDWMAFGVAQSGALRTANGRTADVIGIVRACEARDAVAIERIGRPWWAHLRPG